MGKKTEKIVTKTSYFACPEFYNFATLLSEMKKILAFIVAFAMGVGIVDAAVRDGNVASRTGGATTTTQKRVTTTPHTGRSTTSRSTVLTKQNSNTKSRATATARTPQSTTKNVSARVATDTVTTTETRTGELYETCKTAYFTCMDQFCSLKNDDYRRCSCSNRIDGLAVARDALVETGEQITIFNENLDTVGMTAAQAAAMHKASDGETALITDNSASKALLQAIMNSIRGGDTTVGGKYSQLNSINLSFDMSIAFGTNDNGQLIAAYNGQNLYSAVYPQCRNAVRQDCNNASLQRAVTAYLMAIEQDCNTVQTAIEQKQKELKHAVRESSALLDLARVENRQKHNSDDLTTCINNVESAILSEEVCGANYHKCLDNGEFIDISTGAPITGIVEFNNLGKQLTFDAGTDAANQKLSKISGNRPFVNGFEKRTKKFAAPALDKCREIADTVWEEYLDKAMLDIYYAQQDKVQEIKKGCLDFVSQCYESSEKSITLAMAKLMGDSTVILQPDKVILSGQLCQNYVASCNNMFSDTDIITEYVAMRESEDLLSACRAVVRQCFDKFGGTGYENFYYPYSGLFDKGAAPDWFTLYSPSGLIKSPCAQQLQTIASCNSKDMIERAFGGFDLITVSKDASTDGDAVVFDITSQQETPDDNSLNLYGLKSDDETLLRHRELRSVGVATEVYYQIIDTLSTQCRNIQGRFVEIQFLQDNMFYQNDSANYCRWRHDATTNADPNAEDELTTLEGLYGITQNENMCPRDYSLSVDTESWGICSCWENGGRRSKNGNSATCIPVIPVTRAAYDAACKNSGSNPDTVRTTQQDSSKWCTQSIFSKSNRVCQLGSISESEGSSACTIHQLVPKGN